MLILQNTAARRVIALAFSYDSQKLFAGGDGGYDLWDLATQTPTFTKWRPCEYQYGTQFDPLDRWIYHSSPWHPFGLIPCQNEIEIPLLPGVQSDRHVISFDIARDTGRIYVTRGGIVNNRMECWECQDDGTLSLLWAVHGDQLVNPFDPHVLGPREWMTYEVATNNSGTVVVSCRNKPPFFVIQHDHQTGLPLRKFARTTLTETYQRKLSLSPGGQTLLIWDGERIEHWDVASGRLTHTQGKPGASKYWGVQFHPSGKQVFAASGDGQVRIWNAEDLSLEASMKWNIGKLASLAISPDGSKAAVGGDKGQVCLWDLE